VVLTLGGLLLRNPLHLHGTTAVAGTPDFGSSFWLHQIFMYLPNLKEESVAHSLA